MAGGVKYGTGILDRIAESFDPFSEASTGPTESEKREISAIGEREKEDKSVRGGKFFLFNNETQNQELVDSADITGLVRSGTHSFEYGSEVPVIARDGRRFSVPADKAKDAFDSGLFRFETASDTIKKAHQDWAEDNTLQATAQGLGKAISGHILGPEGTAGREFQALREAHPVAMALGEAAGFFFPFGVGGAASKASAGVMRGVGGVSGAVLGGALEGAASKAIDLSSEDSLGNIDLAAESAFSVGAELAKGAIFGGAVGGAVAGAFKGAQKLTGATKRLAPKAAKALKKSSDIDAVQQVTGASSSDIRKIMARGQIEEAADIIRKDVGIWSGGADDLKAVVNKAQAAADDLHLKLDDAGVVIQRNTVADKIEKVAKSEFSTHAEKAQRRYLTKLAKEIRDGEDFFYTQAVNERRKAADLANYNTLNPTAANRMKKRVPQLWNEAMDEAADETLKKMGTSAEAYRAANRRESVAITLKELAEKGEAKEATKSLIQRDDVLSGAGAAILTGNPLAGAAALGGKIAARKLGHAAASETALKLSTMSALRESTNSALSRIDSAASRIAGGAVKSSVLPSSIGALSSITFTPEGSLGGSRKEAAKERARELRELAASPEAMARIIENNIAGVSQYAPQTAGVLAQHATRVVDFLSSKAPPVPMHTDSLTPLADMDSWEPSDLEISRFERYVKAAANPLSVIDDMKNGLLSKEGVEVLRELYPQLYNETKKRLATKLSSRTQPLPYADRIQLSLLFGMPLDRTMQPGFVAASQAIYQNKEVPSGQAGGGNRVTGLNKVTLSGRTGSKYQNLEEK